MKVRDLKKENTNSLKKHLVKSYRDRLKLLLAKTSGSKFKKTHLLKKVKKNIARILTLLGGFNKKH